MSAVKSFVFGISSVVLAVLPASAGPMNPTTATDSARTQRTSSGINPLSPRDNQPAAENLAPTLAYAAYRGGYDNSNGYMQGRSYGLTLGVSSPPPSSNYSQSVPVQPAAPSNPTPTFRSPAPAQSFQAPTPSATVPDAFINFGNGPYAESDRLTTGNPQSFLNSPVFTHLYGPNGPSSTDVANFESEVISTIKDTYNKAGLAINLTTDPRANASHTMSVISGASYANTPGAIGITDVGNNGFSFIDKFGGVQNPDQLATAIGHNLSHELMHAFGIANHPEQSGPYVDAATSTLSALADPKTGFSQDAANLLSTLDFNAVGQSVTSGAQKIDGDQILIAAAPVPEPSTVALWVVVGGLCVASRRRRSA